MKKILIKTALILGLPLKVLASTIYNGQVVNVLPPAYPAPPPPAYVESHEPVRHVQVAPDPAEDPHQRGLSLGGPRFGISYVSGAGFDKIRDAVKKAKPDTEMEPMMTQFGWQMEYRMFRTSGGVTALTEFIPLVGGMDLGLALPSATWLVGLRSKKGFEVGVGPNFGLAGVSMMLGGGYTFDLGGINIPLNCAVGRGANQTTSFAISTGFNL